MNASTYLQPKSRRTLVVLASVVAFHALLLVALSCASPNEVAHEYKMSLIDTPSHDYDAIIVTVAHDEYKKYNIAYFESLVKDELILVDLKGLYPEIKHEAVYTSL